MNLLAGDIGGTKTLLGIYSFNKDLNIRYKKKYASKDWVTFNEILNDFLENLPDEIEPPHFGCIGVAGKVSGNCCDTTNLDWQLNGEELRKLANLETLELINDFSVLIYGLRNFNQNQYSIVQKIPLTKNHLKKGVVAIIGAGTGLGISRGLFNSKSIEVLPSEGGHREFSPRTNLEWELANWLKNDLGLKRLSLERIVSGNGLGHIARWKLMQPDGVLHPLRKIAEELNQDKYSENEMPEIASNAAKNGDQLMIEALDIWLSAYGSAAGDLALQELCHAGLWIAGGTASKHLEGIQSISFLKSFSNKGRFKSFLEQIPIMALTDPEAGLFSAGCRASLLAQQGGRLGR
tara:strand:- start:9535 stop:10581 length:1047 start_codon:yes stop_codon:yes gene_type:complete